MNLYFITYDDDDGCNLDWFVAAETVEQAIDLWNARDTGDGEEPYQNDPRWVFLVPTQLPTEAGILTWRNDIKEVYGEDGS